MAQNGPWRRLPFVMLAVAAAAAQAQSEAEGAECKANDTDVPKSDAAQVEAHSNCDDVNEKCAAWAASGECKANPGYMIVECASSCRTCHLRDHKVRCKRDPSLKPSLEEGKFEEMFLNATGPKWSQLKPTIHSKDPWLVVYDEFLSSAEAKALLEVYDTLNLERSSNVGRLNALGRYEKSIDTSRTSHNAWCDRACAQLDIVRTVSQRIGNVTGVSETQSEYLQMLRYEPGQYYKIHHDFIPSHLDFPFGPRLYTFFLYLSDVNSGGETHFPRLKVRVTPKAGRAVFWPSVLPGAYHRSDHRTTHEAIPVETGVKYAANAWLHLYDFRTPHSSGCAP